MAYNADYRSRLKVFQLSDAAAEYDGRLIATRASSFKRLNGITYLDHAGTTLYSEDYINAVHEDLKKNIYGNPHSANHSSQQTAELIEQTRYRILNHFGTNPEEYSVIFTSGCTESLKIVAETFKFHQDIPQKNRDCEPPGPVHTTDSDHNIRALHGNQNDTDSQSLSRLSVEKNENHVSKFRRSSNNPQTGCFLYLQDNHTSVLGLREIAKSRGIPSFCIAGDKLIQVNNSEELDENNSYLTNNHNEITKDAISTQKDLISCILNSEVTKNGGNCLFAFPAQSNYNGTKYPLSWVHDINAANVSGCYGDSSGGCYVLLDAAAFVSTSRLDLSVVRPHFVAISFYKIFGYPTGLGALLVRNDCSHLLRKRYFGGGTVDVALAQQDFHVKRRNISDRFEDGTLPFLDILALRHGFDSLQQISGSMEDISTHTFQLARYIYLSLISLRHVNGSPVVQVYSDTDYTDPMTQGPVVNFNIRSATGEYIGYSQVEQLAQVHGIQLRTGCFCNLGACHRHLNTNPTVVKNNFKAGHVCGDAMDLVGGVPTGSIRVSFGYISTSQDAETLLRFITECFVEDGPPANTIDCMPYSAQVVTPSECENTTAPPGEWTSNRGNIIKVKENSQGSKHNTVHVSNNETNDLRSSAAGRERLNNLPGIDNQPSPITLTGISIFPVKSCAAFQVSSWPLGARGFLHDREWMIVTESGLCVTQKREPQLCLLLPSVDRERNLLCLQFPGMDDIAVSMSAEHQSVSKQTKLCQSKVCGDRISGEDCGDEVADWLQGALGKPGLRLIRQSEQDGRLSKMGGTESSAGASELSLANEAQFLLVTEVSVKAICNNSHMEDNPFCVDGAVERFRANLVVSGIVPFEEDNWGSLLIGDQTFTSEGTCPRCHMICIDQKTGVKTTHPLMALIKAKRNKTHFGILLSHRAARGTGAVISVGDKMVVKSYITSA